jgi:hypothetical protein
MRPPSLIVLEQAERDDKETRDGSSERTMGAKAGLRSGDCLTSSAFHTDLRAGCAAFSTLVVLYYLHIARDYV